MLFTESPCGGTLSSPTLLSFNDTNGEWFYYHGKDCLWTLVAPKDSIIHFHFLQLDIDCSSGRGLISLLVSFSTASDLLNDGVGDNFIFSIETISILRPYNVRIGYFSHTFMKLPKSTFNF